MKRIVSVFKPLFSFIDSRPLGSFFVLLGLLLALIVGANLSRRPPQAEEVKAADPTFVQTYTFGQSPRMTLSARIEKSGVISLFAQTPGVVQKIHVQEGQRVGQGGTVVSLSTNYQGGNAASLSRQLAQKSHSFNEENFELQKDLIARQKDLATKGTIQAEELREIMRQSLGDTRALISQNEEIVSGIEAQIRFLESTNVNGTNDAAIVGAKQGRTAAQGGLTQLRSTLRNLDYQSDENKTPAQLGDSSKELTLKQLELQEKSLVLSKDISALNLRLARVSEGLMYPAAPCAGIVERVYVNVGQSIAPGTLIATIKADQGENTAIVLIPATIAKQVTSSEVSDFIIGGKKVSLYPRYISTEATDGTLHSVLYSIPPVYSPQLTNATSIEVSIPIGSSTIVTDELFIPLDSVYQTQEKSYVYVVAKEEEVLKAKTIEISLGNVSGQYVQTTSGISSSDTVIVSRNVQDGDAIRVE